MNHEIINFEWKLSIMDLHESKSTFFFNLIKLIWNGTCISNNAKLHVYCFKVKKKITHWTELVLIKVCFWQLKKWSNVLLSR